MQQYTSFEHYIRQYCRKNNQTIEYLADVSGISRGTFYNILKKGSNPKISHIIQLAHALGVHYTVLLKLKWQDLEFSDLPIVPTCYLANDQSIFIDETIPDGSIIPPNHEFVKTWTIQNIGEQVWKNRYLMCMDETYTAHLCYQLPFIDDYLLIPEKREIELPVILPGEKTTISVKFTAPKVAGRYISYWKMVDEQGVLCFPDSIGLSTMVIVQTLGIAY